MTYFALKKLIFFWKHKRSANLTWKVHRSSYSISYFTSCDIRFQEKIKFVDLHFLSCLLNLCWAFLFPGTEKLRSKREALNYEEPRVISSTNNDYDDNPSWGYAKPKLTCYSCYRSIDGEDCVTLKDTSRLIEQSCEGEQDQCMVCLLRMCLILKGIFVFQF